MFKKILACALFTVFATSTSGVVLADEAPSKWKQRSGVRFGYSFLNKGTQPQCTQERRPPWRDESVPCNPDVKLSSNHMFLLGFELQQTLDGGSWLDILFIQNISVAGLDQSLFAPSASVLIGFEFDDQVQLAVGANASAYDPADEGNYIHLVAAIGYTADIGDLNLPIHVSYVPDVNGYWRAAVTTGVNW